MVQFPVPVGVRTIKRPRCQGCETGTAYHAWSNEFRPNGRAMANTYQGKFPVKDTAADGFVGLAPVASFAPNAYGLYKSLAKPGSGSATGIDQTITHS